MNSLKLLNATCREEAEVLHMIYKFSSKETQQSVFRKTQMQLATQFARQIPQIPYQPRGGALLGLPTLPA